MAWGSNGAGQSDVPAPNSDFVAVAGGFVHSLGLKADGSIVAWGYNAFGELDLPAPNTDFVAVAAGSLHGLGLKPPTFPADITGPLGVPDGCVDSTDLTILLGAWCSAVNDPNPPSPPCENCTQANLDSADIAGPAQGPPDGCVDSNDLTKLLGQWCSAIGGNPCGTCGP